MYNQVFKSLIIFCTILSINSTPLIIITAQEPNKTSTHDLKYTLPDGYKSQVTHNDKSLESVDNLTNDKNKEESLRINFSSKAKKKNFDLEFYNEIISKEALAEKSVDSLYSINGRDNTRVSFYIGDNNFLSCVEAKFKQLNNNWLAIVYKDQLFFLRLKEIIKNYKINKEQSEASTGFFGETKALPEYAFCYKSSSEFTFYSYKIDSKYLTDYYKNRYFATGYLSNSYVQLEANLTPAYLKTFDEKSIDNHPYDKIINSISSEEYEEESNLVTPQEKINNNYQAIESNLKFRKNCFGDFYLESSYLKTVEFQKLEAKENQTILEVLTFVPDEYLNYQVEYDTCHTWGIKKETFTKIGTIQTKTIKAKIHKKEVSFCDSLIKEEKITKNNSQNITIDKKILEDNAKIYLTQEVSGEIELELEEYNKVKINYRIESDRSQFKSLPIFTPMSLLRSIGSGFVDAIASIPKAIIAPFEYFQKRQNSNNSAPTWEKDLLNGLGVLSSGAGTTAGLLTLGAGLLALTGVGLPLAGIMLATAGTLGMVSLATALPSLAVSLALDSEGKIAKDIPKALGNNVKSVACGEYGGRIDQTTNSYIIEDYAYCLGNIGAIGATIKSTKKLEQKYQKIKSSINHKVKSQSQQLNKEILKPQIQELESNNQNKNDNNPNPTKLLNPKAKKPQVLITLDDIEELEKSGNLDNISKTSQDYLKELLESEGLPFCPSLTSFQLFWIVTVYAQSCIKYKELNNNLEQKNKMLDNLAELQKNQSLIDPIDQTFLSVKSESDYQEYITRNKKNNRSIQDRLNWQVARDYMAKDSNFARGNRFNKEGKLSINYKFHEIVLENKKRLDTYVPPEGNTRGKIISRKAIDLLDYNENYFKNHCRELVTKYKEGTQINSRTYPEKEIGKYLLGDYYLEIPSSNKTLKDLKKYEDIAKQYDVTIIFLDE